MTAIGCLCSMLATTLAGPADGYLGDQPVCEMKYVSPAGTREMAIRVMPDGTAATVLRGELIQVQLGTEMVARIKSRCDQYSVCSQPQQVFDAVVSGSAREAGLILPIEFADHCEITLASGTLRCRGSAVLATRLPDNQAVQQFEQLRRDLEQIRALVVLGGPRSTSVFLRAGREALGDTIKLSNVVYADRLGDERVVHFRPQGQYGPLVIVSALHEQPPVAQVVDTTAP